MARYLVLSAFAWIAILAGVLSLAMDLPIAYLMLIQGVQPGTPIFMDELAPAMSELIRAVLIDSSLLLIGIALRAFEQRRWTHRPALLPD